VWQAVEAGADIEALMAPDLGGDSAAARMVASQRERGTRVVPVTSEMGPRTR
jgi:hypothetical protein